MFMNPKQKSMKALTRADQQLSLDYVTELMDSLPLHRHQVPVTDTSRPPPMKRPHLDEFDDKEQPQENGELQAYQQHVVKDCKDILQWWSEHHKEYPALSTVARNILCVMATSAASERNFSLAGHVVSERRATLRSSSVNDILFVNGSLRSKKV